VSCAQAEPNHGRANAKLAGLSQTLLENERLSVSMKDVHGAVRAMRKLAYEIDKAHEAIDSTA
jgi:hypothetical protein